MPLQQLTSSQVNPEVPVNENFAVLSAYAVYGYRADTSSGLTWGYYGGRWGGFSVAESQTLSLTGSATNYIVVSKATGVASVSTSSTNWDDTTNYARVYLLTTSSTAVTATEDHRAGVNGVVFGSSIPVGAPRVVDAITAVNATNLGLLAGDVIVAQGYATAGDGGGGVLLVVSSGTTDLVRTFNIGGGLFAVRPADVVLTPEMAGAISGTGDNTAALTRFFAAGGGRMNAATEYWTDDLTLSAPFRLYFAPSATIKPRAVTANSVLLHVAVGAEGSIIYGPGVIDGRRPALKAGYIAANPTYPGYYSVPVGLKISAANVVVSGGVMFTNHIGRPCDVRGDYVQFDAVAEDHGDAAVFGWQMFGTGAPPSRPTNGPGGVGQAVRFTSIRADNSGCLLFQHAIDTFGCKNGTYSLKCFDMGGDTSGGSSYMSGITIERDEGCTYPELIAHDFVTDTLIHLGVSRLGSVNSPAAIISVQNMAGQGYEQNGCIDSPVSILYADGMFRGTTACPVGSALNVGVSEYSGVWNEARTTKSATPSVRSDILGGTIQRWRRGAAIRVSSIGIGANVIGNILDGVLLQEAAFTEAFSGAAAQRQFMVRLWGQIAFNGRAGVYAESFRDLDISHAMIYNNGQDSSNAASTRGGVYAASGRKLTIRASSLDDTQDWTDTDTCTFAPQSSVNNFLTVYLHNTGRVCVGQFIRLVNGTGAGDVTAKVWDVGLNDEVILQTSGAVTLSATGNTAALTGAWSGSGTTLTGTGTAATTEIVGVTYVTDGSEWRRVIKATSNTSILIDSAFASPLSGASLSKLLVDVASIPSQQQGAWVTSTVTSYLFGPENSYQGNVSQRTVVETPTNAMTGCVYYRRAAVNAASGFNLQNLQTGIPIGHRLSAVAVNVDTAISGGSVTSWGVSLTNAGGTVLETIATGLALTKNTKHTSNCVGAIMPAAGNLLRALYAGAPGIPTAGAFTSEARYVVDAIPALADAP